MKIRTTLWSAGAAATALAMTLLAASAGQANTPPKAAAVVVVPSVQCVTSPLSPATITFTPGITNSNQEIAAEGTDIALFCYSPNGLYNAYEQATLHVTATANVDCVGKGSFSGHATLNWDQRLDDTHVNFTGTGQSAVVAVPNHSQGLAIAGQGGGLAPHLMEMVFLPSSATGDCSAGITAAEGAMTVSFTLL